MKVISSSRIASYDLFRSIAVLTVILGHYDLIPGFFADLGVDIFFVLSGILISNKFYTPILQQQKPDYLRFIVFRTLKIWPSYFLFLIFGAGFFSYFFIYPIAPETVLIPKEIPQYLFFYRNYGGPPMRLTTEHLWSLCVEEHFYWILPVLFITAIQIWSFDFNRMKWIGLSLIAFSLLMKFQAFFTNIAESPTQSHNRLDAFGWGLFASWVILRKNNPVSFTKRFLCIISGLSLITLLFLNSYFLNNGNYPLFVRSVTPLACFLLILGSYSLRLPASVFYKFIARISYNWYLWHLPMVILFQYYFSDTFTGIILYLVCTMGISYLFNLLIEEPILKKRNYTYHWLTIRSNNNTLHKAHSS